VRGDAGVRSGSASIASAPYAWGRWFSRLPWLCVSSAPCAWGRWVLGGSSVCVGDAGWLRIKCKQCGMFLIRIRTKDYQQGQAVLQFELNCQNCKYINVIDLNIDPPENFENFDAENKKDLA
jgi:hypothetical protein